MSTKIYNGYRLASGTDLFEFAECLRTVMNPIRERLDAQMLMDAAIAVIDAADVKGEPRPTHAVSAAMTAFRTSQRAMDSMLRGHDPHRFEVAFGTDRQTGSILALLYTDKDEFVTAWEALPEVESYGYWNNTDQPDDVTDEEWEERRLAWDRLLPGATPPFDRTISFSLRAEAANDMGLYDLAVPHSYDTEKESRRQGLLRSVAKSKRARARKVAVSLVTQAMADRARESGEEPDFMSIASRVMFTLATDEDNYESVIDAVEAALQDDVVDFVLAPAKGVSRPVNLEAAYDAAEGWVDRNAS